MSVLIFFTGCTSKKEKRLTQKELLRNKSALQIHLYVEDCNRKLNDKLNEFIESLPLEEKIAQMFIENLEGHSNFRSYETYEKITGNAEHSQKPLIAGGYLFFSYNLAQTSEDQKLFVQSIKNYSEKNNQIVPFLAIDQEGGWVNRLKKLTGGLPSQEDVAKNYTPQQAHELYKKQALQMSKDLGFTMNLAPVLEVCTEKNKDFLDGRSFGTLEQTIEYGKACVNAYEQNGIAVVVKHFPGNTNTDPHTGLPEITDDFETLNESLQGFKQVIQSNLTGVKPAGILMSHARTTVVDSGVPACLSKVWVTDVLRNQWGYEGIIFSDDIFMGALAQNGYPPEVAAIKAVEAGVDCIMTSEKRFGNQAKVLYNKAKDDSEFEQLINKAVKRILKYKLDSGLLVLE